MEYKDMLPHQQRVVGEKVELDDRVAKLRNFINESSVFVSLNNNEQKRLGRQYILMDELSDVLGWRIAAFGTEE